MDHDFPPLPFKFEDLYNQVLIYTHSNIRSLRGWPHTNTVDTIPGKCKTSWTISVAITIISPFSLALLLKSFARAYKLLLLCYYSEILPSSCKRVQTRPSKWQQWKIACLSLDASTNAHSFCPFLLGLNMICIEDRMINPFSMTSIAHGKVKVLNQAWFPWP